MAYALVGTIGAAVQGAASAAVTPTFGTGESRTVGNLLVLWVSQSVIGTTPGVTGGWTLVAANVATVTWTGVYYRIATGADSAPTVTPAATGIVAAQLAEFSGNGTTSDQVATNNSSSSPLATGPATPDVTSGELLVVATADRRSASRTPTDTITSNNATITQAGNNNGVSSANHYSFGYGVTTSNAGAYTATVTASVSTSLTELAISAVTILLPTAAYTPAPYIGGGYYP